MYWDYWEEKGGKYLAGRPTRVGLRWKGQDADEVAVRNQSSTDAYRGLGLRTFILGGREEMTHRRVFKQGQGCDVGENGGRRTHKSSPIV